MAKSKKTKKAPKVSVARILGFCLLGLLAIGAVANVIKALPKEEEPVVEYETATLSIAGPGQLEFEVEYFEGMTWEEFIEHNEDSLDSEVASVYVGEDGYVKVYIKNYHSEQTASRKGKDQLDSEMWVAATDLFDISTGYSCGTKNN